MCLMRTGLALIGGLAMSFAAIGAGQLDGTWGGDQLRIVFAAKGAVITGDCAQGYIDGPIVPTSAGSFAAMGTYEQHRPGAQPGDRSPAPADARYVGTIDGEVMTLSIVPMGAATQTFTLRRGAAVRLHRCF